MLRPSIQKIRLTSSNAHVDFLGIFVTEASKIQLWSYPPQVLVTFPNGETCIAILARVVRADSGDVDGVVYESEEGKEILHILND